MKAEGRLVVEAEQHVRATINRSLEANSRHFNAARTLPGDRSRIASMQS
jgi:hypothetical protein